MRNELSYYWITLGNYSGELGFAVKEWLINFEAWCTKLSMPNNLRLPALLRELPNELNTWLADLPNNRKNSFVKLSQALLASFCPSDQFQPKLIKYFETRKQNEGESVLAFARIKKKK